MGILNAAILILVKDLERGSDSQNQSLCIYLIVYRAGHVWGLDAWVEKLVA
jgi:hypothetical protein